MSKVHSIAAAGFAQGTNELYDRIRPSYPAGSLQALYDALPKEAHQRGLRIIEPGAGTGIFTRLLFAPPTDEYPKWNIDTLVGVEPSSGMREAWEKGQEKISATSESGAPKAVRIVDGTFDNFSGAEQYGLKEGTVDLIVIAQAWHWCPDHEAAFTEIAKYLAPTGILAFIWNIESGHVDWQRRARELFQQFDKGTPQYYKGLWKEGYKAKAFDQYFEKPEQSQVSWNRNIDDEGLLQKVLSISYMTDAYLKGEQREQFIKDFKALLAEAEPDKEYVDKEKGIYKLQHDTDLIIMRKK